MAKHSQPLIWHSALQRLEGLPITQLHPGHQVFNFGLRVQ